MNSENRPAGGGSKNNKNRRKPYYIKKKPQSAGDDQNREQQNRELQNREPQTREPQNREQQNREQQNRNRSHHNRRNRQRDKRKDLPEVNLPESVAAELNDNELLNSDSQAVTEDTDVLQDTAADSEVIVAAAEDDITPEVVVNIVTEEQDENRIAVTGVRFKPGGKVYYFDKGELEPKTGSYVIVETARGLEFGEVAFGSREARESSLVLPLRPVVRLATDADVAHHNENKQKEEEAFRICLEKIKKHGLDMKLIEAQYSFDNSKLLFYFTSASRVDFRELVKDLASVFKTRIELRQIGIRDEAKIMGGLGVCGRSLCCSTFLSDFVQVSIKMAKEQNLSLNSGKISGCCGRLMCCLQYEYKTYAEETAKTPPVDSLVKTREGVGFVTEINPLAATVKVKLKDKPDTPPMLFKRDEVTVLSRAKKDDDED